MDRDTMRLKVISDHSKYMNPERKARLIALQLKPIDDLTQREIDEYNGIRWWQLNLLRLLDADKIDEAFTEWGLLYAVICREQAAILKLGDWRGGKEDHTPESKIISL